jgi:hypothetical protein
LREFCSCKREQLYKRKGIKECAAEKAINHSLNAAHSILDGALMRNSLKNWHDYFVHNSLSKGDFDWRKAEPLTPEERECVGKSIATFQLGEHSEGKGLIKAATAFAKRQKDVYLTDITKLFIAEEQNHALLLRKFLELNAIPLMKHNWTDNIFRRLRKNVGFEISVSVLICAEILSLVYYDALKKSTNCDLLKKLCDKILADEMAHVKYESEMLCSIWRSKSAFSRALISFLHKFLFIGTILVVYLSHRKALNRGKYDFANFVAACWLEFSGCFPSAVIMRASASA